MIELKKKSYAVCSNRVVIDSFKYKQTNGYINKYMLIYIYKEYTTNQTMYLKNLKDYFV